jgi:hypothetical protein
MTETEALDLLYRAPYSDHSDGAGASGDQHWALGMFYHNPDDPARIVENRFGNGVGFNYAYLSVKIGAAVVFFGGGGCVCVGDVDLVGANPLMLFEFPHFFHRNYSVVYA